MGSSSPKSKSIEKNENIIEEGELGEKDKSYITTVIQVLYNIKIFQEYFINNEYKENPNKYLSILMKKIVTKRLNEIDFVEEGNQVSKLLRTKYDFIVGKTPGEIIIQILLILKYEEKEIITNDWEKFVYNKPELFKNIPNKENALNDLLKLNMNHYNTAFSSMFFGIFYAKRKLPRYTEILYFFNFYCVYEINMPQIYEKMINKGKIKNDDYNLPKIELIDCIKEMQETQNELFKDENCFSEYYMFSTPKILIFLLKSEDKNIETPFRGIITFEENSDFSEVIKNEQSSKYKLISIINKKRYASKKKDKNDVQWMENANDDEIDEKSIYKAIFRNENDQFCEYGKYNSENNCQLEIDDIEYYHEILIFMKY